MAFVNITDEVGNLIVGQDGNPIGFGEDHIHLLRHEIHGTFEQWVGWGEVGGGGCVEGGTYARSLHCKRYDDPSPRRFDL